MTLKELYALIGGDYDQAVRVMKMDKLIDRYVRKFKNSNVGEALAEAGAAMDGQKLFEAAHAMKGVCGNLGFDDLANAADAITEEFRPGNPRTLSDAEVAARLTEIDAMYKKAVAGIERYENEG